MLQKFISTGVLVAVGCVFLMSTAYAQAPEVLNPPAKIKTKKKAAKVRQSSKAGKVRFIPGSQETTKERSARLQRECKDLPNAGACSGYGR